MWFSGEALVMDGWSNWIILEIYCNFGDSVIDSMIDSVIDSMKMKPFSLMNSILFF